MLYVYSLHGRNDADDGGDDGMLPSYTKNLLLKDPTCLEKLEYGALFARRRTTFVGNINQDILLIRIDQDEDKHVVVRRFYSGCLFGGFS